MLLIKKNHAAGKKLNVEEAVCVAGVRNINQISEAVVRCQAKGWIDEALMQDWIQAVWNKVGGISRQSSRVLYHP